jgi:RNA polymerase sigma-70 factor, ECF subfamily
MTTADDDAAKVRIGASVAEGADLGAFERVYRDEFQNLVRVATAICGDPEQARDAVQDGVARALAGRSTFRREGALAAWVWRAVVRSAQNAATRSRQTSELDPNALSVPASDRDFIREAEVRRAVAALPERQRLVLFLRYYADLDYAEIARIVGIRRGTVSATLHAAHASVRASLSEETA